MSFDGDLDHPPVPAPASGPGWLDMDAYPEGNPDSVAPEEQLALLGAALRTVPAEDVTALSDDDAWGQMLDRAVAVEDLADLTAAAFDDAPVPEPGDHDPDDAPDVGSGGHAWTDDDDWADGHEWAGSAVSFDAHDADAAPDDPDPAAETYPDQP